MSFYCYPFGQKTHRLYIVYDDVHLNNLMQRIDFNDIKYDTKSNASNYIININNMI